MHWYESDTAGEIIVDGNGRGNQSDQFQCPDGVVIVIQKEIFMLTTIEILVLEKIDLIGE